MSATTLEKKSIKEIKWILINEKEKIYSDLKSLSLSDPLGLFIAERSRLIVDLNKLDRAIESLIAQEFGSENIERIKGEK